MLRTKSQAGKRERVDLSVVFHFMSRLEAFQRLNRIVSPLPIYLALEVASIRERLLDLLVPLGVRMELVAGT